MEARQCDGPTQLGDDEKGALSMCGKLVGHFPVASWLRPACSFVKRLANSVGWDSKVDAKTVELAQELWKRVETEDPVGGVWDIGDTREGRVWCDASSLAVGACLEIEGEIVEDNNWLRRTDDTAHINLAESEAVLKGVNLAIAWGIEKLEVMTDSRTVFGWLKDLVTEERRIKTHGLGEALMRRRLALLRDVMDECSVTVSPTLVRSNENKSDRLTRVPKNWITGSSCFLSAESDRSVRSGVIQDVHSAVHCGVDKTSYLVNVVHPDLQPSKEEVRGVVSKCWRCKSIDPDPVRWEKGELSVAENWTRLACDVTHYAGKKYLTIIDSGPSRYAIWKAIPDESLQTVVSMLEVVFREFGPPRELLLDNSATFRSEHLVSRCRAWNVNVIYRAAYRPSGNGIIERHHRTVKRAAARTKKPILVAVFWYNFLPRVRTDPQTCPHRGIFRHSWSCPLETRRVADIPCVPRGFVEGDPVLVKPRGALCTTRWDVGQVTRVTPEGAVEVDGVHRHVGDLRKLSQASEASDEEDVSTSSEEEPMEVPLRRSARVTARPWRYDSMDYDH